MLSAHLYAAMVDGWMEDQAAWLAGLSAGSRMPLAFRGGESTTGSLRRDVSQFLETVLWDRALIPAKLARAMSGAGPDLAPSADAQGSAKVALLSMDRSLRSWAALRSVRPPGDRSAHALITQLTALRHDTERRFPTARRFLRPGFDDPEANEARRRSDRSGQNTSRS